MKGEQTMKEVSEITVRIIEQPGKLGKLKASALSQLLVDVNKRHPEIDEAVKKKQEEKTNATK